jgi:hypothetical protein
MKKLMLFAALLGFAVACGGGEKKEEPKKSETKSEVPAETPKQTDTEESTSTKAATPDKKEPASKTIELNVNDFDAGQGYTITELDASVAEVAPVEDTRVKKGATLRVDSPNEFDKGAHLKVGAELNTTTLEVVE